MPRAHLSFFTQRLWPVLLALFLLSPDESHSALTIVRDKTPIAVIVTRISPNASVSKAVDELNHWLKLSTGTTLPVVTAGNQPDGIPVIAVGLSPFTDALGLSVDDLGPEGARIIVTPTYAVLIGRDSPPDSSLQWWGTYYAVGEFTRRFLNARHIWPGPLGEVFQKHDSLVLQETEWTWETSLTFRRELRNPYTENQRQRLSAAIKQTIPSAHWNEMRATHDDWLLRHRMNRPSAVRYGHAFTNWWVRFSRSTPEWFAQPPRGRRQMPPNQVKLDLTNSQVADQVIKDWVALRSRDPIAGRTLSVAPNDGRGFCASEACRSWDSPAMDTFSASDIWDSDAANLTDRYVRFWNIISERARRIDPTVKVTTYAYRSYKTPPTLSNVAPELIVGYVGGEGFYPEEPDLLPNWSGWRAAGATLFWRPNFFHSAHGLPFNFARALGNDFATLYKEGMIGTDFDALLGFWATQGLNYFVAAERHIRPMDPTEDLLADYFSAFGPAAGLISQYFDLWEKQTNSAVRTLRDSEPPIRETWGGGWHRAYFRALPKIYPDWALEEARHLLEAALLAVHDADPIFAERLEVLNAGLRHSELLTTYVRAMQTYGPNHRTSKHARGLLEEFRLENRDNPYLAIYRAEYLDERWAK